MITVISIQGIKQKLADYKALIKLNLSLMVVSSSLVSYWVAPNISFDLYKFTLLFIGGMLVTAAANASNEILERHTDALMNRTKTRPLPSNTMSFMEAFLFAIVSLGAGIGLLWYCFNLLTAFLSLVSYVLYVLAYTPLKRISPINVFVGAIPGALPALIGWVAATGNLAFAGWSLFLLQFIWQFPHFWSIGWLGFEEYKKAGLKMLPLNSKDSNYTPLQCLYYSVTLLLCSAVPYSLGITNLYSVFLIALAGLWFVWNAIEFYKDNSDVNARKLMFASFVYLPVVYLAFLIFKV